MRIMTLEQEIHWRDMNAFEEAGHAVAADLENARSRVSELETELHRLRSEWSNARDLYESAMAANPEGVEV